jgi:hypothetical protein
MEEDKYTFNEMGEALFVKEKIKKLILLDHSYLVKYFNVSVDKKEVVITREIVAYGCILNLFEFWTENSLSENVFLFSF